MQWWMNGVDYKYIISAKPMGITPASIPVAFELTVLFSAFTSFLGMIALNQLPKFSNPVFTNPRFDRATNDRFFLYVEATDKYYNRESVRELLGATHPDSLDEVLGGYHTEFVAATDCSRGYFDCGCWINTGHDYFEHAGRF